MEWLAEFFLEPFEFAFMRRALAAALLIGLSGGLLGCLLVLRRLALMGDALAHSLLPGIGLAWLLFGATPWALFVGALIAGLLTSLGSALICRLTRLKEEAAFAALFVLFLGTGIVLVSFIGPQIDLLHFLFGNILGVGPGDVWLAAGATLVTVTVVVLFFRNILVETFDPVFYRASGRRGGFVHLGILSLVVLNLVAALQAMGVVLALGLFILPAVTAYLWTDHLTRMLAIAAGLAMAGTFAGLLLSYHAGLASGASIVLCLGVAFLATALGSPRYGMVARLLQIAREGRAVVRTAD
ncbi:MAG: metal ABC transporter permease [Puniceicoccaceae bacterium]|nr:MAG: metal ABC transporter permease [Puniceicoccaceae bacterium]